MADVKAEATVSQKAAPVAKLKDMRAQVLARRMKAVEEAGNMTPKMQRNFDRFVAKIHE